MIKLNIGLATVPLGSTAHRSWHMQPNENELFLCDISQQRMPLLLRQYGMVALRGDGQVMWTGPYDTIRAGSVCISVGPSVVLDWHCARQRCAVIVDACCHQSLTHTAETVICGQVKIMAVAQVDMLPSGVASHIGITWTSRGSCE